MIEVIAIGLGFTTVAVVAFVAAIRVGMVVGLRLDRVLAARAADGVDNDSDSAAAEPVAASDDPSQGGRSGLEEYHRG